MNDLSRTSAFVGAAVVALGIAVGVYFGTKPAVRSGGTEKVGEVFFEDFDIGSVTSLEVSAIDTTTQELRKFKVEKKDGLWRIPSHHNYPAEAAERLFRTATSMLGLEREVFVSRLTEDHKRLGVLNPDSEDEDLDPEETGTRITLRDINDDVLADVIVGKQKDNVETGEQFDSFADPKEKGNYYYVRREDETPTYLTRLDLDISTRFSDWIEPDLLKLESAALQQIEIDNYSLQSQNAVTADGRLVKQIGKIQADQHLLKRDAQQQWQLEGIDEVFEELQTEKVNAIVSLLDDMTIVGVRPKTQLEGKPLLNPDLTVNSELQKLGVTGEQFQRAILSLQNELSGYGFNIAPGQSGSNELTLLSERGQITASTKDGIVYTLYFGEQFNGDESAIEIGGEEATSDAEAEDKSEDGKAPSEDAKESDADPAKSTEEVGLGKEKGRYLMVSVDFDEKRMTGKPQEPAKPEEPKKPEGYLSKADAAAAKKENDDEESEENDAPPTLREGAEENQDDAEDSKEGKPSEASQETDDRDPKFIAYDQAMVEYKTAAQAYALEYERFRADLKAFKESRKEASRKAKELNERFGPWFYVISGGDLESLQIPRTDLVKKREITPETTGVPRRPDISFDEDGNSGSLENGGNKSGAPKKEGDDGSQ